MNTVAVIETAYQEVRPRVYRYLRRKLKNPDTIAELTQETFARALGRADVFTPRCGRNTCSDCTEIWLMRIAERLVLDHVKSARFGREILIDCERKVRTNYCTKHWGTRPVARAGGRTRVPLIELVAEPSPAADIQAIHNITRQSVITGVAKLDPGPRECVTLRYLTGLSTHETAAVMNRPVDAVRALQYRAVKSLRRHLHRLEGDAA